MSRDSIAVIRKLLPFTSAAVVIAALYLGWVFYSRWEAAREAEIAQKQARVQDAQKVLDAYGGNKIKVLNLSLSRGAIRRGETAQLCYGVSNAKTVTISPPVGQTWPSMYRCLDVTPTTDTTYTLTASDGQGHTDSKS
ncbi:MAG TPA: hypothetical protein VFU86_13560, partial [Terriglobales bacterium]|nr:hypothetical protein [Terriglobales bacterium]